MFDPMVSLCLTGDSPIIYEEDSNLEKKNWNERPTKNHHLIQQKLNIRY